MNKTARWFQPSTFSLQPDPLLSLSLIKIVIVSLFLFIPSRSNAASLNVPLGDWKYEAIERVALVYGVKHPINSRPMSRLEMASIVKSALTNANKKEWSGSYIEKILSRLEKELSPSINELEGKDVFLKFVKNVKIEGFYTDAEVERENNFGDSLKKGWNLRLIPSFGISTNILAANIAPRISIDKSGEEGDEKIDFLYTYLKLESKSVGVEAGKTSGWWGPGRNGAWVLTNNAAPLTMIRLYNPLPYSIAYLGAFKFNLFYGRTSEQIINSQDLSSQITKKERPHFGGIRLNSSLSSGLEAGASIAAMFAGRNGLTASDVKEVFFPRNNAVNREKKEGPITDRIASIDLAFNRTFTYKNLKGIKIYLEYGGTDLSFVNRIVPRLTDEAYLTGFYMDTGITTLRLEYSQNFEDNDAIWYTHGQFTDGYTNKKGIMGYHIGGMAKDIYVRLTSPLDDIWSVIIDYENISHIQKMGSSWGRSNDFSVSLDYFGETCQLRAGYEYRQERSQGKSADHNTVFIKWNVPL